MTTAAAARSGTADGGPARRIGLLVAVVLVTVVVSVALLAVDHSFESAQPGLSDPGTLVRHGLPVVRAVFDVAACLTVGLLVLGVFLVAPEPGSEPLELHGTRARGVRLAAVAGGVWLASGVALLVLTYADVAGTPLGSSGFGSQLSFFVRRLDLGRSELASLVCVMVVATCAGGVRRVFPAGWITVLAVVALYPIALTGHAAGSTDHQNAVDSLFVHLLAVTVWVGGLLALLVLMPALGRQLAPTARRYSTLAAWCFAAVAVSGVVNAWLRVGRVSNLTTPYGVLVLVKVALLVVLGAAGWWHRRHYLARLDASGDDGAGARRAFARLATGEVLVMAVTLGVAVALSRTAPPVATTVVGDRVKALIGYPFPGPETIARLFTAWYPDLLWLAVAGLLGGSYVVGVLRMHRRGDHWSVGRTIAWLAACALLVWATSGGPAVFGEVYFSGHMVQHMSLMMLIPILLVLGAPMTLALRTVPRRTDRSMGPREWLLAALHSRFLRFVAQPIVAALLFIGSLVGFYYSGLLQLSLETHTGHELMVAHFLLVGYLFVWVLIGVDPGPPHPPYPLRLLLLLATISFHAFFGLALMTGSTVLAPAWWASLGRTNAAALVTDQHLGGGIMWGISELPTLTLVLIVGIMWARDDDREARRLDRTADRDGDAVLNAYNEQLARLARHDHS